MKRYTFPIILAAAGLLAPLTACSPRHEVAAGPAPAVSAAPTDTSTPVESPTPPACPAPADSPAASDSEAGPPGVPLTGLLRAIRTGHHRSFDRVVFEFAGAEVPEHHIEYVPQVHQDPSDRPVPLRGNAFLRVAFQGGTTDTAPIAPDPRTAPGYTGPTRLSPDHPLVKEVAIAGDFERVLSFGIGVDRVTGLHVTALSGPPRLVVDFWSVPPCQLLWPARTIAEARELQEAADEGHQPWLLPGSPVGTSTNYAERVLGWPQPRVQQLTETVVQVAQQGTGAVAVLTLVQPVRKAPDGLWVVADVAR